jgi:UDP-N-acetylglucosamine--N-acetylmuramyl-(pentapeptide) pyrophosphoryl-undecaprenol N-acetylglucosamine transferase
VFTAFPEAAASFPARKVAQLGNPVRRIFLDAAAATASAARPASDRPHVLVVGGSQGARAVNDCVLEALGVLRERGRPLPALVHQVGTGDLDRVTARYRAEGFGAHMDEGLLRPVAFIDDMAGAYAAADLVIARAGALTLAELAVAGRPAILLPLPTAAADHQTRNARAFADAGAALLLDQETTTGAVLVDAVVTLLDDPGRRATMALAMRTLARPGAAGEVADRLQALIRGARV